MAGEERDLYTHYIASLVSNSDFVSARKEAIQSGVQAAIKAAASSCPCCLQSHQLTQQATQSILWVGTSFRFDLEVPVQMCHGRGTQYSPKPLEASCMPASQVHSWDVSKAPYGSRSIWFDLSLVKVRILFAGTLVAQADGCLHHHDLKLGVLPLCELKVISLLCKRWTCSCASSRGYLWTG
jgi:hypothetical protein